METSTIRSNVVLFLYTRLLFLLTILILVATIRTIMAFTTVISPSSMIYILGQHPSQSLQVAATESITVVKRAIQGQPDHDVVLVLLNSPIIIQCQGLDT